MEFVPEPFHPHLAAVTGAHTHHGEHDHHHAEPGQFVHMALDDHAVDDEPGQQRNDKRHGVVDAEQYDRADHTRKVRPAIRQYPCKVARLLAFRFGSTYIRSVPSNCLLGSWLGCCWVVVLRPFVAATIHVRRVSSVPSPACRRQPKPLFGSQNRLILNEPYADATDAFRACRNHNKINIYTVTYHWFAGAAKTVIGAWLARNRNIATKHRTIMESSSNYRYKHRRRTSRKGRQG